MEVISSCFSSFSSASFLIPGFSKPVRLDRSSNGGGIKLFTRENITIKVLSEIPVPEKLECMFFGLTVKKKKWFIGCCYNPSKDFINDYFAYLAKCSDHYSPFYDNILLFGDFNSVIKEISMNEFCEAYTIKNLVKEPTCPLNPTCIDYTHFSSELFQAELNLLLPFEDINNITYDKFDEIIMFSVNKHIPLKYKYIRAHQGPFMNKTLRKAITQWRIQARDLGISSR